jgi:hypothetical protein
MDKLRKGPNIEGKGINRQKREHKIPEVISPQSEIFGTACPFDLGD